MSTATEHRYSPGKVDYNTGRRNCKAEFTWTLQDGQFSMCAAVWNPRHSDIYCGGQCVDKVATYFPRDAKAQRMLTIWREWHLNHMTAGSPAQEAWLKVNPAAGRARTDHYTWACRELSAAGLNPDPGYLHNGKPYAYGSAWLKRDLPAEVVAEIESWSRD